MFHGVWRSRCRTDFWDPLRSVDPIDLSRSGWYRVLGQSGLEAFGQLDIFSLGGKHQPFEAHRESLGQARQIFHDNVLREQFFDVVTTVADTDSYDIDLGSLSDSNLVSDDIGVIGATVCDDQNDPVPLTTFV